MKYSSTYEATIIEKKDDIANGNLTSDEIKHTVIERNCTGVHIKKQQTCVRLQPHIGYRNECDRDLPGSETVSKQRPAHTQ